MKKIILLILCFLPLFGCGKIGQGTIEEETLDYMYRIENKEVTIVSLYDNHSSSVIIPDKIEKKPVTKIESNAFKNFKNLKELILPASITTIGTNILTGCSNLEKLTVPFTEEASYLKYFFGGMEEGTKIPESLSFICIADGVEKIYSDAFYGIDTIEELVIPQSVKEIGPRAFKNCINLRSVTFIGDLALTKLDTTSFDTERLIEVEVIDDNTYDSVIKPIIIVNNLVSQAYKNFFEDVYGRNTILNIYKEEMIVNDFLVSDAKLIKYLGNNTEITVPDNVVSIERYAFANNKDLRKVYLSSSIKIINSYAFMNDINLEKVIFNDKLEIISDGAFDGCKKLNDIIITPNITNIGMEAFANCQALSNITIPNNVVNLGSYVFRNPNPLLKITVEFKVSEIPVDWQSDWNRGIPSINITYLPEE